MASELRTATLGRMTESIAKELNECLCAFVINSSTCLRMLSANPPNVEGALETARRTIRSINRAAEAVSRLSPLLYRKEVNGEVFCTPGLTWDTDSIFKEGSYVRYITDRSHPEVVRRRGRREYSLRFELTRDVGTVH